MGVEHMGNAQAQSLRDIPSTITTGPPLTLHLRHLDDVTHDHLPDTVTIPRSDDRIDISLRTTLGVGEMSTLEYQLGENELDPESTWNEAEIEDGAYLIIRYEPWRPQITRQWDVVVGALHDAVDCSSAIAAHTLIAISLANPPNEAAAAVANAEAYADIVSAMCRFPQSRATQRNACMAIASLATTDQVRRALVQCGAVEAIIKVLETESFKRDATTLQAAF